MTSNQIAFQKAVATAVGAGIKSGLTFVFGWMAAGMLLFSVVGWLFTDAAGDDTDGIVRSNLRLHTDFKTGCQYLSSASGGVVPRTAIDGKTHLGCRDGQ